MSTVAVAIAITNTKGGLLNLIFKKNAFAEKWLNKLIKKVYTKC